MYCSKCGNQLPENSSFCNKCGEKIRTQVLEITNLSDLKESVTTHQLLSFKKRNNQVIFIVLLVTLTGISLGLYYNNNYLPNKFKNSILHEIEFGDIQIASEMTDKYIEKYGVDEEILKPLIKGLEEYQKFLDTQIIELDTDSIVVNVLSYDKGDVKIEVTNVSDEPIGYIGLKLHQLDDIKSQEVLAKKYSPWSGTLLSGDTIVIDDWVLYNADSKAIKVIVDVVRRKK